MGTVPRNPWDHDCFFDALIPLVGAFVGQSAACFVHEARQIGVSWLIGRI